MSASPEHGFSTVFMQASLLPCNFAVKRECRLWPNDSRSITDGDTGFRPQRPVVSTPTCSAVNVTSSIYLPSQPMAQFAYTRSHLEQPARRTPDFLQKSSA